MRPQLFMLLATAQLVTPGADLVAQKRLGKLDLALKEARAQLVNEDYSAAIRTLRGVSHTLADERLHDMLAAAHGGRGLASFKAEDYRRALQDYAAANRIRPGREGTLQSLGVISWKLRERQDARRYMERVLQLNSNNADALGVLGRVAASFENTEKAGKYFSLAAKVAPGRQDYARLAQKYSKESSVEKRFVTLERGNFKVMFERGKTVGVEKAVQSVMGVLEQAHRELVTNLGQRSHQRIQVMIYNGDQYQKVSSAHVWARAYYDGKLRIAIRGWPAGRDDLRRDLRHELTHAFLHELYPGTPLWVHEGYAQVLEGRKVSAAASMFRNGRYEVLPLKTFTGKFAASRQADVVHRGYAQSLAVVGYLLKRGNRRKFQSLLAEFRRGTDSGKAVQLIYRMDLATLVSKALR